MGRVYLLDRDELKEGENTVVQIRLESPVVCLSATGLLLAVFADGDYRRRRGFRPLCPAA